MTRQHFKAIADALKASKPKESAGLRSVLVDQWRVTAEAVRDSIRQFNGNFNRDRFDRAAGITE